MSGENVVKLSEIVSSPDEDAVAILREALADAERGELHGVVIVGFYGDQLRRYVATPKLSQLLGFLEFAKWTILHDMRED